MTDRESWLNGWTRAGHLVLIGTGIHCAGCGKFSGVASVAISGDEVFPDQEPDWPFDVDSCPVHQK